VKDIETIYDQMKEVITREVQQMTHLEVIEVNVNVVDIKTQAEYQEESETVQDKLGNAAEATGSFMSKPLQRRCQVYLGPFHFLLGTLLVF
jgi:hypothetical protein